MMNMEINNNQELLLIKLLEGNIVDDIQYIRHKKYANQGKDLIYDIEKRIYVFEDCSEFEIDDNDYDNIKNIIDTMVTYNYIVNVELKELLRKDKLQKIKERMNNEI